MGRAHLMLAGFCVASEGDICRDPDILDLHPNPEYPEFRVDQKVWTRSRMRHVAAIANRQIRKK